MLPVKLESALPGFYHHQVPRKNELPENEQLICMRLANIRKTERVSRAALARDMKIENARLAAYELIRVVVPYEIGRDVCQRFNINQRWLATGINPARPYFPVDPKIEAEIIGRKAFSAVYDTHLKAMVEARHKEWDERRARGEASPLNGGGRYGGRKLGQSIADYGIDILTSEVTYLMGQFSDEDREMYLRRMLDASHELVALLDDKKKGVDNLRLHVNLGDVTGTPATWSEVIERAKAATAESGSKGRLADKLGVAQSRLSEWLSTKVEPGASIAFKLLAEVVELEKQQNKKAANASTSTARTAPTERHQEYEDQQPEPGKPSPGKITKAIPHRRKKQ